MAESYVIQVSIEEAYERSVDEDGLERVARRVLESEGAAACELSVAVTDDETVRRLNREYAGEDYVTDVLSFSHLEGEQLVGPSGELASLGEVVIAYPQAERQAEELRGARTRDAAEGDALRGPQGEREWSVQMEMERLLAHGVLHLLGYDHAEPDEEREMRARVAALMEGLSADGGTG